MSFKITLLMTPIPKGRPRVSSFRKRGDDGMVRRQIRMRTPERTDIFENDMRARVVAWLGRRAFPLYPKGTPVALDFDFVFKRPADQSRVRDPFGFIWKLGTPDIDNLQKSAMDALKGVFWDDDAQVVDIRSRKMYADKMKGRQRKPITSAVNECLCIYVREASEFPLQRLCSVDLVDRLILEGIDFSPRRRSEVEMNQELIQIEEVESEIKAEEPVELVIEPPAPPLDMEDLF